MLKKLYKNNGVIYLCESDNDKLNKDIKYNNIYLSNYNKYKDTLNLNDIKHISKKEYYNKLKCLY